MTSSESSYDFLLNNIRWDNEGLVPVIAQQYDTKEILMMAWMSQTSLIETLTTGQSCYWSRSRKSLWRKGETSGQTQRLVSLLLDCDGDTLIALVDQQGVACHTGHRSCFFRTVKEHGLDENAPVIIAPSTLYEP